MPAGKAVFAFLPFHRRGEKAIAPEHGGDVVRIAVKADREPGEQGGTEGGRLPVFRSEDAHIGNVGLELHEQVVCPCATVHPERPRAAAHVARHGGDEIFRLVGNRFQGGADDVTARHAAGQTHERTRRFTVPVRRAQSGKGGDEVHPAAVGDLGGKIFTVAGLVEKAHLVPQPLHDGTPDEHAAFQRIGGRGTVRGRGKRGDEAAPADDTRPARVGKQETAGAVGALHVTEGETPLPEKCRLLVADDARNGDARPHDRHLAENVPARKNFREHGGGDAEEGEQPLVPHAFFNIEEHGARGVGAVGRVDAPLRQFPEQPGIHRTEQEFSPLGALTRAGDVVQDPREFGRAEIGIGAEPGFLGDVGTVAVTFQGGAYVRRAAALPHDRGVDGPARRPLPHDGRLPLVGDADGGDRLRCDTALRDAFGHRRVLGGIDFHRVLLHPARLRIILREFMAGERDDPALTVKENGTRARRALVQCQNVLFHKFSHPALFLSFVLYQMHEKKQEQNVFLSKNGAGA